MSVYSNLGQPEPKPQPPADDDFTLDIEGSFLCQVCNEDVEHAQYFMKKAVLSWECSSGHVTASKEFKL